MKEVTFALAVCTIAGAAFSAELRTWTVRSSVTHEIDAEFVVVRGNRVILKTDDGREVAVPIDRLSAADGAYVRRRQGADRPAFHAPRVPVVELIGISVDKPIPRVEERVLMASTAGTSVRFLVMTDLHVVSIDEEASEVVRFSDNRGTNLLPQRGRPSITYQGPWRLGADGRAATVAVRVEATPSPGAKVLAIEGVVVMRCAKEEKTAESELIDLNAGGTVNVGRTTIKVEKGPAVPFFGDAQDSMDDADASEPTTSVRVSGKGPFEAVKSIAFIAEDGRVLEQKGPRRQEDSSPFDVNYRLSGSVSKLRLKVVYFEQVQSVEVPIAFDVGVGL